MIDFKTFGTKVLHGVTLRQDPLREDCYTVVQTDAEMHEYQDMGPIAQRERLHRHMNNETGAIEIAAQCLVEFPEAPWDLRMQLARQCWDESRHVSVLLRRLKELGGRKGEFPVTNFEWCVTCMLDSLAARLALQNRTFEAGELDLLSMIPGKWREVGDEATAEVLEGILSDEVQHVRFANVWVKRMAQENPRVLLKVAMATNFLAAVTTALAPKPGEVSPVGTVFTDPKDRIPPVNIEDRKRAEFTDDEIHSMLRKAGLESLIPSESPR
ncbi:MAG TPA: DUF455 family protein [Terriglobia bacterium]|nr:DUF455 family protein [Terriglobia bacterium]